MTEEILTAYEDQLDSLILVPSDAGRFEVEVDGELIYSKLKTNRHVEAGEIPLLLGKYLKEHA